MHVRSAYLELCVVDGTRLYAGTGGGYAHVLKLPYIEIRNCQNMVVLYTETIEPKGI